MLEAEADVDLTSLNLYNPDDSVEAKLVPNKKRGVLAVQVILILIYILSPHQLLVGIKVSRIK